MFLNLTQDEKNLLEKEIPDIRIFDKSYGTYKIRGATLEQISKVLPEKMILQNVKKEVEEEIKPIIKEAKMSEIDPNAKTVIEKPTDTLANALQSLIQEGMVGGIQQVKSVEARIQEEISNLQKVIAKAKQEFKEAEDSLMQEARELVSAYPESLRIIEDRVNIEAEARKNEKSELDKSIKSLKEGLDNLVAKHTAFMELLSSAVAKGK